MPQSKSGFRRILVGLMLFGISFGYVEAAVVAYLRAIYEPIRERVQSNRVPGDLFPLLTRDQLAAIDQAGQAPGASNQAITHRQRLFTELGREAATLVMLGGAALLVARNFREWLAAFVLAFGVWDIFFYAFLKVLLGWPASLMTWDILFLLPVPWVGPVITPMLVAAVMAAGGATVLWREHHDRPVVFGVVHWIAIVLGGVVIVVSFCWDWRNTSTGGYPNPFNWILYGIGLLVAILGFAHGLRCTRPQAAKT